MNILSLIQGRFGAALSTLTSHPEEFVTLIRPTGDSKFGDYQANCAMPLAKVLNRPARDIAESIVNELQISDLCHPPEIAGPGFINLKLKDAFLTEQFVAASRDSRMGIEQADQPRNFIIDYSSPNVAKPMHVGHLRSSVIGASLYHLLKFLGHHVQSDNHIGDWGTQFGMIIYGYKHFLNSEAFAEAPVKELSRLYRLVNRLGDYHVARASLADLKSRLIAAQQELQAAEEKPVDKKDKAQAQKLKELRNAVSSCRDDVESAEKTIDEVAQDATLLELASAHPDINRLARLETAKLHQGDVENQALWTQFLPACLEAMNDVYRRLGISFDMTLGESYYQPMLSGVVDDLKESGLARESQGAMCVFIEGNPAPFIVQKGDGAYTYATTDLATIWDRVTRLHAQTILYVVDARQGEHFQLLFETARLWKYPHVQLQHVSFGTVMGADRRPYKTRSGDTVGLESLLDEAVARAHQVIEDNEQQKPEAQRLSEVEIQGIAERVGIGGIKYADLKHHRESDYVFDWDKMLAKKGDTATYMQYAYARICGIFRKGEIDREQIRSQAVSIQLDSPIERALALKLLRFHEALDETAKEFRPNILCQYLFETADLFSTFYDQSPILSIDDKDLQHSRLRLCDLTARIMQQGLSLLGIQTCEQM